MEREGKVKKIDELAGGVKIKYGEVEYADQVISHSTFRIHFLRRVQMLWHPEVRIDYDLYTSIVMKGRSEADVRMKGRSEADVRMTSFSYWDLFMRWWRKKFGFGYLQAPMSVNDDARRD